MFDTDVEKTIVVAAAVLWFAQGWYLNTRLENVHKKLDALMERFDGLRRYLYEIDPQFDDERKSFKEFQEDSHMFAGKDHMDLVKQKEAQGRRTLNSPF